MENKMSKNKILINIILMIALVYLCFHLFLKGEDQEQLFSVLKSADKFYIMLGIGASLFFILADSINIQIMLSVLGYPISLVKPLKYSLMGFFFSGITPSASGGQPVQLYEMKKDGIDLSHSSLTLLLCFVSYQLATLIYGVSGLMWYRNSIFLNNKSILIMIGIGLCLNIAGMIFVLFAIFSPRISFKIYQLLSKIVNKLPFIKEEKKESFDRGFKNQIEEYNQSASYIKNNKKALFKMLAVTLLQMASLFGVSYAVYRALGQSEKGFLDIIMLQAVIYLSSSFMPLPGAVGVSESNFLSLFKSIYAKPLIGGAMILSRGISFYLLIFISMLSIGLIKIFEYKEVGAKGKERNEKDLKKLVISKKEISSKTFSKREICKKKLKMNHKIAVEFNTKEF